MIKVYIVKYNVYVCIYGYIYVNACTYMHTQIFRKNEFKILCIYVCI